MSTHTPFHKLYTAAIDAYPEKTRQVVQCEVTKLWNEIKEKKTTYDVELNILIQKARKIKTTLYDLWSKIPKPSVASSPSEPDDTTVAAAATSASATVVQSATGPSQPQEPDRVVDISDNVSGTLDGPKYDTPAQKKIRKEIDGVNKKISDYHVVKQTIGLSLDHEKKLKELIKEKTELEKKVKKLVSLQKAQIKFRKNEKRKHEELVQKYPESTRMKQKSKG